MAGSEIKKYLLNCDEIGCSLTTEGTLDAIETVLNWLYKVVDENGVPTECYCNRHRNLHE